MRTAGATRCAVMVVSWLLFWCNVSWAIPPGVDEWDCILDYLGITLTPATVSPGQTYWKVTKVHLLDNGGRSLFFYCLDENGQALADILVWNHRGSEYISALSKAPPWPGDFPLYGHVDNFCFELPDCGWFGACVTCPPPAPWPWPTFQNSIYVDGISDEVTGFELPCNQHISFEVYFQRTIAVPTTPSPTPTTLASPTPSIMYGDTDCNGIITPGDALKTFEFYLELEVPATSPCDQAAAADYDANGSITPGDALCIFRQYLNDPCL